MEKNYTEPKFTLVRTDEQNKVFFAISGGPNAKLSSIKKTNGEW